MKQQYELIVPDEALVKRFNDFWNKEPKDIPESDWIVELFKGIEVDIREYDGTKGKGMYETYGCKDSCIMGLYTDGKINAFFKKINSVYHTRVPNIVAA